MNGRIFVFCISIVFLAVCGTGAQTQMQKTIGNVTVVGLSDPSNADRVKLNAGLFTGKQVTIDDFSDAVRKIWRMGTFNDVRITTENFENTVVNIKIEVKENPRLDGVIFEGNDKVKSDKLSEILNLYRSQVISPLRVSQGKDRILKHYEEKGYLLATVKVDTMEAADPGRISLVFNVNEGQKVKIKKIMFDGNEAFDDGKLRKQFEKTKQDGWFTGGDFNKYDYEVDKKKIPEFYAENGYRDARVLGDSIYFDESRKHMFIVIDVDEGDQYYFRNIEFNVEGEELYEEAFLKSIVDIGKGDVYNKKKLTEKLGDVNKLFNDRGYLLANVFPAEIPVGRDSVDLEFGVNTGPVVTVDKISIHGNTRTKEKVIRREIKIRPGDRYSYSLIERSFRDIYMLNYFANVAPDVDDQIDDDTVDLSFTVEEKSTDTANMSAGYSQRDGMIGSLGLSMNNFMGNGQQVSIDWQFGKIYRAFQIGFTEPYLMDTPTLAGFSVYDIRRGGSYYGYDQESRGFQLRLGRRLRWPDNWFLGNWYFEYSKNRYFNIRNDTFLQLYFIGRQNSERVSVTQVITRDDTRIKPEFPEAGSRISLSTQFSGGALGGNEHYIKTLLTNQFYLPAPLGLVLYTSAEFGHIKSIRNDNYISPMDLFYLGGSALSLGTMLRGYEERSVGPSTPDGYPLGGKVMMKYTSELRFQMSDNPTIYGLMFAESGNNWLNTSYMDPFDLRRSVGVGLRLFLPMVGMLGIDFGYGFDNFDAYGNRFGEWKPHFQFGRGF